MAPSSTSGCSSIFQDGKLKQGIYKIRNLYTENYLDVHLHSMELCCRPAKDLGGQRGFWQIMRLGDGYAIWRVDPGNPYQFCSPTQGLNERDPICVTTYPVSWRIERTNDKIYHGFEYVRLFFGPTDNTWDLWGGSKDNGVLVRANRLNSSACQVWRFIPVEVDGVQSSVEAFGLGLPPYDVKESEGSSAHR